MNKKKRDSGFTLIETVVVMMVAIIMGLIATTNFARWMENSRFRGAVTSVYADLQFARLEAIKRNQAVQVDFTYAGGCNQEGGRYSISVNGDVIKTVRLGPIDPDEAQVEELNAKGVGICDPGAKEEWTPGDATTEMDPFTTFTYDTQGIPSTAGFVKVTSEGGNENSIFVNLVGNQKIN